MPLRQDMSLWSGRTRAANCPARHYPVLPATHWKRLRRSTSRSCGHRTPASKLLVADIAELNPRFDPDGRTARTAARIAYEMAAISPSRRAR